MSAETIVVIIWLSYFCHLGSGGSPWRRGLGRNAFVGEILVLLVSILRGRGPSGGGARCRLRGGASVNETEGLQIFLHQIGRQTSHRNGRLNVLTYVM